MLTISMVLMIFAPHAGTLIGLWGGTQLCASILIRFEVHQNAGHFFTDGLLEVFPVRVDR